MDTAHRIRALVAPLVAEAGAEIYDVELAGGVLRISVDRPGGVDIGAISSLTRAISRLIDDTEPIAGSFTLEVSSPGLERRLRTPEHFARSVGEVVSVKARAGVEGDRRVTGTLTAADDDGFTVTPAGAGPDEARRYAFDDVERVRTVFEWGPAPKPGGPKSRGARSGGAPPSPSAKQKKAAKS